MTNISGSATHPDPATLTAAELRHLGLPVPQRTAAEEQQIEEARAAAQAQSTEESK